MSGTFKKLAAAILTAGGLAATIAGGVLAQAPRPAEPPAARAPAAPPPPAAPPGVPAPPAVAPAPAQGGMFGGGMGGVAGPVTRGWEYKKVEKALSSFDEEELNKLGADGWELVASEHVLTDRGVSRRATVFKRQKMMMSGRATAGGGGGFNPLSVLGGPGGAAPTGGVGGFAFGGTGSPNFDDMADRWLSGQKAKGGKVTKDDADARTKAMFDELDANKDGLVDKAEYRTLMEQRFKTARVPSAVAGTAPAAPTVAPTPVPTIPAAPAAAPAEPPLTMLALKHMQAEDAAKVVSEVFNDSPNTSTFGRTGGRQRVKVVAEPTTNTLIVRAAAEDLRVIQALVDKLDAAPATGKGTR